MRRALYMMAICAMAFGCQEDPAEGDPPVTFDRGMMPDGGPPDAMPPDPDLCDGEDDDADGRIDEDAEQAMVVGRPCDFARDPDVETLCDIGRTRCINGIVRCEAGEYPIFEEVNDLDDDCDGRIDEYVTDLGGVSIRQPSVADVPYRMAQVVLHQGFVTDCPPDVGPQSASRRSRRTSIRRKTSRLLWRGTASAKPIPMGSS